MSGFVTPGSPNLADYTLFLQNSVQIPTTALPVDSPWISYAFNQGMAMTQYVAPVSSIEYVLAVYNCAAHIQIVITPDQPGQTYFQQMRGAQAQGGFGLSSMPIGFLSSASDNGTAQSMVVPDSLRNLTIGDLQFLQTPWGRFWLSYCQDFGSVWGLS